ncbi:hypothetical protein B0T26DRAFT_741838 [Lasiosphaeria miniovina]|uniref:Ketoreductase (KR) domain-containing protein n=1 Tax=Lasiosphaeria miniovina TaxID=1954250 RepID=A0AA40ABQ3_9PEZI|nr:uncharacterized protein B0T26DRAFT_741838 [Lasiosphaeria miniovina]KAK0712962.1 hypothetical protein B0T26DRAFT_741838 [Lasiosphaeria miniovina]
MPSLGDFPSASFASQAVIITGANAGLGKEIVKHLISLGASKVIFACRSHSRGTAAKRKIEELLKCGSDIIEVWELDFDMLPRLVAVYGTDRTLALIPKLEQTARVHRATPRMTTVASALYDVAEYPKHGDVDLFA